MKKSSKIVLGIASIPLLISFLIVISASSSGTQECIFCHHPQIIYGLEATISTGGLLIIVFYPIYVLSLILIFKELYKIKVRYKDIKKYFLYLISGSISIVFSLLLVLATIFIIKVNIVTAFLIVCIFHPFILISNIISIVYIIKYIIESRKCKIIEVNQ
ncbi:MAG: hypothetical protein Q4E69_02215 [Bacilli bacterium]|nr:hypothetical protein [Bacilli bacterium]